MDTATLIPRRFLYQPAGACRGVGSLERKTIQIWTPPYHDEDRITVSYCIRYHNLPLCKSECEVLNLGLCL